MKTFKIEVKVPATITEVFHIAAEDMEIANQKALAYFFKEMDQDGEYQEPSEYSIVTEDSEIEVEVQELRSN